MIEKVWVDCPICGAKGSMAFKSSIYDKVARKGHQPVEVGPLEGYFCKVCDDGFYTRESLDRREQQIAEIVHTSN